MKRFTSYSNAKRRFIKFNENWIPHLADHKIEDTDNDNKYPGKIQTIAMRENILHYL